MNIYKVTSTLKFKYDAYSSFVCFAESVEKARLTHPGWGDKGHMQFVYKNGCWVEIEDDYPYNSGWPNDLDGLIVDLIGVSCDKVEQGVVCCSYHAG